MCQGILAQSAPAFEVAFCDDGSGPGTRQVIQEYRRLEASQASRSASAQAPRLITHYWQEHRGFRKSRILNQALRAARGVLGIFLDGDCLPHPKFVADHLTHYRPGCFQAGRRVELGPVLTQALRCAQIPKFIRGPSLSLLWSALRGDSYYIHRSVRISTPWLRRCLKLDQVDDLKGCNYSAAIEDLVRINGFDESYEGYGREDTDVELRLLNLGLRRVSLKGLAIQYHLHHPRRQFTPANDQRLDALQSGLPAGRIRCLEGLQSESVRH